jgi:short subunit dehydrogenase-like uncharacterized protein
MPEPFSFLLYGANGYTAGLIINAASAYRLQPILGGRNGAKMAKLAKQHNLPYRIADLHDSKAMNLMLKEVAVVLHCAGPFSQTALPMQRACLRCRVHYLDITGEIAVFEQSVRLHSEALERNIMLMPGTGFDVVPTDCLALHLKHQLPDATHLQLAFWTVGGAVSHGTAATAIESSGAGGIIRQNGKLTAVKTAHKTLVIPFTKGRNIRAMSIPWGDVSTAFHTTGIPNIETYMAAPPAVIRTAKLSNYFNWLTGSAVFKRLVRQWIDKRITGPDEDARKAARAFVWGKVWNEKGEIAAARLQVPDGYSLTAATSLIITKKVLAGDWQPGFQTPAGLYGADLILEVEETKREDLS